MKRIRKVWCSVIRFTEKQGFPILATLCVAVITATALWTKSSEAPNPPQTPAATDHLSAAQLMQQSLKDAATPFPASTATPPLWLTPVKDAKCLQGFNAEQMVQSSVTGVWALHDSVDLATEKGEPVFAMADGVVCGAGEDPLRGGWVRIDHADGYTADYMGIIAAEGIKAEKHVKAGQLLGYVANGPLEEGNLGPHLHLRVTKDGQAVDPAALWNPI